MVFRETDNMKQSETKKQKGFTLVELLITTAVIVILTVAAIVSYSGTKSMVKLETAQQDVSSALRLAQSHALQGKIYGTSAPCGFGIRFRGNPINAYDIFYNPFPSTVATVTSCEHINKDIDKDGYPHDYSAWRSFHAGVPASVIISTYTLPSGVTVNAADPNDVEFYFSVPNAEVFHYDEEGARGVSLSDAGRIVLSYPDIPDKKVTVSRGGLIEKE